MRKICLAASSGGHLDEMSNLDRLRERYETILLTEEIGCEIKGWFHKVYYVPQVNRKEWRCLYKLIKNAFISLRLLIKEKPDTVISTGALATIPVCLIGKLMKKRVIYIESFARMDSPSKTGKIMYKIADKTVVQWEEMKKIYPNAIYGGNIY